MNKTAVLLGCSLTLLAACASGPRQRESDRTPQLRALISGDALVFTSFDADNDLKVSTAEVEAGIAREWARADVNGDGFLQPLEFNNWAETALGGSQLPPYRLDFDRNVDNSIAQAEFAHELNARAVDYDKNHDGLIERSEMIREIAQPHMIRDRDDQDDSQRPDGRRRPPPN